MKDKKIAILGTGFISDFYTSTLHALRSGDRVVSVYSRVKEKGEKFAKKWGIANFTDDLTTAVRHPDVNTVIIGLPNHLHLEAVKAAAAAGKAVSNSRSNRSTSSAGPST